MNKTTKGTIAAGAAVLLLLGGGGTLAYWNDTAPLAAQTITAGQLAVKQIGTPTWKIAHANGAESDVTSINDLRIVPGDKLIYKGEYDITAQGQNLAFKVSLAEGAIQPKAAGNPADVALKSRLQSATTFTVNGTAVTNGVANITKAGTNDVKTHKASITATITWPFGDAGSVTADNGAKQGKVDLSQFTLTVEQVAS